MESRRQELLDELERYYEGCGWKVERTDDGTVRAAGLGGVIWIGMAVIESDIGDVAFETKLLELSEQRMPQGELCPLELLPDEAAAQALRSLLDRLRLAERGHVEVYSLAA